MSIQAAAYPVRGTAPTPSRTNQNSKLAVFGEIIHRIIEFQKMDTDQRPNINFPSRSDSIPFMFWSATPCDPAFTTGIAPPLGNLVEDLVDGTAQHLGVAME
jgi:hypothetical protein